MVFPFAAGDAMPRSNIMRQNRGTSSADLAERAAGYTANGESEFTRHVSHGARGEPSQRTIARVIGSMTRLDQLIFKNCRQLANLEERMARESDPEAVARHIVNARKKAKFIAELRASQRVASHGR